MGIGERLKTQRINLNMTRVQLADAIHVTPSAIANYENNISYPKPDILISLIQVLKVDANYLYQDYLMDSALRHEYGSDLSASEKEAIHKYRVLDKAGKQTVQRVIHDEFVRVMDESWVSFPCYIPSIRKLNTGFILQNPSQTVYIKQKHVPPNTQFCFQIQVDEYQPIFKKNDLLALKQEETAHNEIGLFSVNGICYIRNLFHAKNTIILKALNVMDPDIVITEKDDFYCYGTVIDKIYGRYNLIDSPVLG